MDDSVILNLYRARSESAINETATKYGKYCQTIATNILRNNEDVEECVNDTYLKAWHAIPPKYPSSLSSFLGKITRNLSLNKYKEQQTQKRGGGEIALLLDELENCVPSKSSVESEYESNIVVEAINAFLLSLSTADRVIFVRRYWYTDSIYSIATRFQMSESKVKSMLYRARKKLKIHLEKEGVMI